MWCFSCGLRHSAASSSSIFFWLGSRGGLGPQGMMKTGFEFCGRPSALPQYLCAELPGPGSTAPPVRANLTCPAEASSSITSWQRYMPH